MYRKGSDYEDHGGGLDPDARALRAAHAKFSDETIVKLRKKHNEGRRGWDDPVGSPDDQLKAALLESLEKGNFVDVANFAMFLWNRQQE